MATGLVHANTAAPSFVGNEDVSYNLQSQSCSLMKSNFEVLVNEIKSLTEIISILKEEQKYHSATSQEQKTINSCTSKPTNSLQCTADDWETKSTKGKKGSSEGNTEIRNNEVIRSKNETVEMRNRFSALETDDEMQISENKKNICENLSRITTSIPKTNTKHNKQECIKTASPQKEPRKREEMQPNLQSKNLTPRQHNTKETNETHKIPTIINGRLPWEVSAMTSVHRSTLPQERKPNTNKRYATRTHIKHNLQLLGHSHTRGLAERIG